MAKQNARLKSFFEGMRRKCTLQDYRPLKTKAGERRLKLSIAMPLSNQPVDGMPDDFMEEYILMVRDKSKVNLAKVSVDLEGALISIFSTDANSRPAVKISAATLNGFRLVAAGIEEKRTLSLEFVAYCPWSDPLRDWVGDHIHADFFTEVEPQQLDLPEPAPKKAPKKKDFDADAIKKAAKSGELVQ